MAENYRIGNEITNNEFLKNGRVFLHRILKWLLIVRTSEKQKPQKKIDAILFNGNFDEKIQIATSSEGEDWNTFFVRVLDILVSCDNGIISSYVAENRVTLFNKAGLLYHGPLLLVASIPVRVRAPAPVPIPVEVDASISVPVDDFIIQTLMALLFARCIKNIVLCDDIKGDDGKYSECKD
jgi:hypothetical protein